ncbi:MAG: chemotaxis protein CheX [Armatimonadota bacterium]
MAFLFETPEMEDQNQAASHDGTAIVTFTGPISGELHVASYGGLMQAMAADVLGEDTPTMEQQQDLLGEVSNVICGSVLPRIAGSGHVFRIGPPRFLQPSDDSSNHSEPVARVNIPLNEGAVEITLFITETQAK